MIKLRHVGLVVTNMERSLKLYKDYFGLNVVWNEIEEGKFIENLCGLKNVKVHTVKLRDCAGGIIELLQYLSHSEFSTTDDINRIGCSHLAVTVDNVDKVYEELLTMGLKFNAKPLVSQDGNAKVCFCRDFDGIFIELVEELNGNA